MADLLEVAAEAMLQHVEVVALLLGGAQEVGIGHQHCGREVARQGHASQRP